MINLNPNPDEENEFIYIEMIDTVAYEKSRLIKDFEPFFEQISHNDLTVTKMNKKMGKLGETIKYEYMFVDKRKKLKDEEEKNKNKKDKKGKKDLSNEEKKKDEEKSSKRRIFSYIQNNEVYITNNCLN